MMKEHKPSKSSNIVSSSNLANYRGVFQEDFLMVFKEGFRWDSLEFYKQTGLRIGFLSFLVKDI